MRKVRQLMPAIAVIWSKLRFSMTPRRLLTRQLAGNSDTVTKSRYIGPSGIVHIWLKCRRVYLISVSLLEESSNLITLRTFQFCITVLFSLYDTDITSLFDVHLPILFYTLRSLLVFFFTPTLAPTLAPTVSKLWQCLKIHTLAGFIFTPVKCHEKPVNRFPCV